MLILYGEKMFSIMPGDNRKSLKTFPDNSFDSCVTDPPYALVSIVKRFGDANAAPAKGNDAYMRASAGFMGKQWDTGECAMSVEFWAEVYRVLKPGAFLCAFGATRGYHRMACAIEDAGFEIRDSLAWLYGTGFPKSYDVSKGIDREAGTMRQVVGVRTFADGTKARATAGVSHDVYGEYAGAPVVTAPATPEAAEWGGWGTALKPAFEPIVLARKPLSESTVAANVLRWRTGAINVDGCRVAAAIGDYDHTGNSGIVDNCNVCGAFSHKNQAKPNDAGRFPANVVHDGSDEVVSAFPVTGGGGTPREKSPHKGSNWAIDAERSSVPGGATSVAVGSAARFFYSAKASKADRNGSKHPTVKPIALMQWLCRLVTPPGGTVLDPFAGSGTTGAAALAEGFRVVLCERETEYVADIQRRLGVVQSLPWAVAATKMPWEVDAPAP